MSRPTYEARDHFNGEGVRQIQMAKEAFGFGTDAETINYAIALLDAARKAKELGGELVVGKNDNGSHVVTHLLGIITPKR